MSEVAKAFLEGVAAGVAAERERCAKVCEALSWTRPIEWWFAATKQEVSAVAATECAAAIRAGEVRG